MESLMAWSLSELPQQSRGGRVTDWLTSTNGNLWIAMFASYRVMVFSPEGEHLKDIVFSANNMACTTWGGKNFDILFVATGKDKSVQAKAGDEGGHMFRFKPVGVNGMPKNEFAG